MGSIEIKIDDESFSHIYSGARIEEVGQYLKDYSSVYIVYDHNVAGFAEAIASTCTAKGMYGIQSSEQSKNIETAIAIDDWLLNSNADRNAFLLAIGGGITTDLAGFAASIYRRGIRFAYVPTTLLAQVDAAIGGKTGVNYNSLKNMLGVIRQPEFTYLCPEVLETLTYSDFTSGVAELLKTFIICNRQAPSGKDFYSEAVEVISFIHSSEDRVKAIKDNSARLQPLIHEAAAIKAGVVMRDPFEKGERRMLNLGHTFGHAIEWLEHSSTKISRTYSHGEAVAIGIIQAAILSEKLCLTAPGSGDLKTKLEADFKTCGLPTELPCKIEDMASAMSKDKKADGGQIHFILIRSIGEVADKELPVSSVVKLMSE
jgi:3-dehydroquinate synthase